MPYLFLALDLLASPVCTDLQNQADICSALYFSIDIH